MLQKNNVLKHLITNSPILKVLKGNGKQIKGIFVRGTYIIKNTQFQKFKRYLETIEIFKNNKKFYNSVQKKYYIPLEICF